MVRMREDYASVRLDEKRDAVGTVVRLIPGDFRGDPPKSESRAARRQRGVVGDTGFEPVASTV